MTSLPNLSDNTLQEMIDSHQPPNKEKDRFILKDLGFNEEETNHLLNEKQFDDKSIKKYWNDLTTYLYGTDKEIKDLGFGEQYWQKGVGGRVWELRKLVKEGKTLPKDFYAPYPEDTGMLERVWSQLGTLSGDLM